MKLKNSLLMALSVLSLPAFGQGFSLRECIDYASKWNATLINADKDVEIADRKIKETIGSMLPQVDLTGSYTNNLKLGTTLLPGALTGDTTGRMIPVQFGTQHNASATMQVSQKLFDPTFGIGLKAAKVSQDQAGQTLRQSTEQLAYNISLTYFQTLVIDKQRKALQASLSTSSNQLEQTELKQKNGMAKQLDVDKMRVSFNNLKSQLQQSDLNYAQSLNNLKYYMGMPVENEISLTDTTLRLEDQLLGILNQNFSFENRTDYQLQKINVEAYQLDKARNQAMYLPSLNLSFNYGVSAMRKEFNFFDSDQNWFDNASLVFSLKVPIFDGLQKHQRVVQSKLNLEKAKARLSQTEQSIKVDLSNYENQYRTAVTNIQNEKDNLTLSENVYKNTRLSFQQGMATALELVQAENSWNESMNNYYGKLLNLYIARINLEQARGNLLNYISK
jgi:outer membrane protein